MLTTAVLPVGVWLLLGVMVDRLMPALGCLAFHRCGEACMYKQMILGNMRFKTKTFVGGLYHLSIFSAIL